MSINNINDIELVRSLYIQHRKLLNKIAFDILKDKQLAEDAIQLTMEQVIKNLDKIDEEDYFRTRAYLASICRNISINMYNKRKKEISYEEYCMNKEGEEKYVDETEDTLDIVLSRESVRQMSDIIVHMKPDYRDVFIYKYAREYSNEEIAEIMNLKSETVRKRLARAKKKIIEELKRRGENERE